MPARIEDPVLAALARIEERLPDLRRFEQVLHRLENKLAAGAGTRPASSKGGGETMRMPGGGNDEESWLGQPEERTAAVMAPFANAQRLKLLKALYLGISESSQLKEFTGLTGGQLYHHLKELALAKFLSRQIRGEYRLSSFGYHAFSAFMILAADLLAEEPDEDVVEPEEIELD